MTDAARGARATALVVGGTASKRRHLAQTLHAAGRTAEGPLFHLDRRVGMREMLVRVLTRGVESVAPATVYFDRAECLDRKTRGLVAAVLALAEKHWLEVPGRRDGLRLIAGVHSEHRLDPALARGLGVLRVTAR